MRTLRLRLEIELLQFVVGNLQKFAQVPAHGVSFPIDIHQLHVCTRSAERLPALLVALVERSHRLRPFAWASAPIYARARCRDVPLHATLMRAARAKSRLHEHTDQIVPASTYDRMNIRHAFLCICTMHASERKNVIVNLPMKVRNFRSSPCLARLPQANRRLRSHLARAVRRRDRLGGFAARLSRYGHRHSETDGCGARAVFRHHLIESFNAGCAIRPRAMEGGGDRCNCGHSSRAVSISVPRRRHRAMDDGLLDGWEPPTVPPDPAFRAAMEQRVQQTRGRTAPCRIGRAGCRSGSAHRPQSPPHHPRAGSDPRDRAAI